ncbi:MAG: hypothetical protein AAF614_14605 [Chloroflexota bacterium]
MDFGIKQLAAEGATLFHLYDKWDRLRFVADQGSPWLIDKPGHYVRLARTDGHLVASLNLPWVEEREEEVEENGRFPLSYAILIDHAVYAVIEVYPQDNWFVLEVEENRWLLMPNKEAPGYDLLDNAPSTFRLKTKTFEAIAAEPIGQFEMGAFGYDVGATWPKKRPLRRPAILTLAVAVLMKKFGARETVADLASPRSKNAETMPGLEIKS